MFYAYAAAEPRSKLRPFEYDPGPMAPDQVEIKVTHCGICHSDLSMLNNDWGMTQYPFVPGHEVVGKITAMGDRVPRDYCKVGDTVGLGWTAQSCMHCFQCLSGDHNLCATAQGTIVGRYGGFADKVRCQWIWATKLPAGVDPVTAGPLFCGGITVFTPLLQHELSPTARVGVVGIGGLGHMAIGFLNAWGCEVTAFSTSPSKEKEAKDMGAHHFVSTRDSGALEKLARRFDMIISTVNVELPWDLYTNALAPHGTLHIVGAVPEIKVQTFPLLIGQRSIAGNPTGSPTAVQKMLDFCARHKIKPITETFKMSDVNDAMEKLRSGSPRYRIVLEA